MGGNSRYKEFDCGENGEPIEESYPLSPEKTTTALNEFVSGTAAADDMAAHFGQGEGLSVYSSDSDYMRYKNTYVYEDYRMTLFFDSQRTFTGLNIQKRDINWR